MSAELIVSPMAIVMERGGPSLADQRARPDGRKPVPCVVPMGEHAAVNRGGIRMRTTRAPLSL